jgi:ribosome maturation factor RimP
MSSALQRYIEDCTARRGVSLIDLTVRGENNTTVVEVYIGSEDGITTGRCSEISRDIAEGLDDRHEIAGSYRLTVSSPGIERPLKYPWQYKKHIGRTMQIKTRSGEAIVEQVGKCTSVDDTGVVLEIGKQREHLPIAFAVMVEARVKTPW